MTEANKELVRRHFEEIWNRKDLTVADELMATRVFSEGTKLGATQRVVPPTGKRFAARQTHWFRVGNGRLAKHWATARTRWRCCNWR